MMEHQLWRVWHEDFVIELYARTKTEALTTASELLNVSCVKLNIVRIYDW